MLACAIENKKTMIGLEPLYDFVELCLWTGAVAGERPASAIIVAAPGGGKSSLLEKMQCPIAPFVTDMTSREISGTLREFPQATHILLTDMMAIFSHRKSVTQLACSMLSSLTGDAMRSDSFSGNRSPPRMLGLITAIPTKDFMKRQVQSQLASAGFATRFMILRFSYSLATQAKIHDYIKSDLYTRPGEHKPPEIPIGKVFIEIPADMATLIHSLAMTIKSREDELGTRIHHHLRALVKARARRDNREIASTEDTEAIQAYANFFGPEGQML